MEIHVEATVSNIETLNQLIKKLNEIQKEHSRNCTLDVKIMGILTHVDNT